MYKSLTKNNTYRHLDVINKLLTSYNSVHPPIGVTPREVIPSNIYLVFRKANSQGAKIPHGRVKFGFGDFVRITKEKLKFAKCMKNHFQLKCLGLRRLFSACPNLFTYSLTCRICLSKTNFTFTSLSLLLYHPEPSSK